MRRWFSYSLDLPDDAIASLISLVDEHNNAIILTSNEYQNDKYAVWDVISGFGVLDSFTVECNNFEKSAFDLLSEFCESKKDDFVFGHLTYDLKNSIESLNSENQDKIGMPEIYFFQPSVIITVKDGCFNIGLINGEKKIADKLFEKLKKAGKPVHDKINKEVKTTISKDQYLEAIKKIKKHIKYGDIYEMNFCQEFFLSDVDDINPQALWYKLNDTVSMPFAGFYKLDKRFLLCASPERFLAKRGNVVISQPIKGTAKRGSTPDQDDHNKKNLESSEKERSENVMIVDLVRNDLSRTATKGSVTVEELCKVYPFPNVFQMISTVKSVVEDKTKGMEIIQNAFPMGSMTGTPKLRAMQLIEEFESTKRGLFSGSIGYINPNGDFDFNVIIRSILINRQTGFLSFNTGGAITNGSDPEMEYQESMVKAQAMIDLFNQSKNNT